MKAAIYTRISTEEQHELNQVAVLEEWAKNRGFEIYGVYCDIGSAWQHANQQELRRLLADCHRGKVNYVLVHDLSRLTRKGPYEMMHQIKQFGDLGVQVLSYQDTWFNVPTEFLPILLSLAGFFAQWESKQISERTKAGMARVKAEGKHIGRPRKN